MMKLFSSKKALVVFLFILLFAILASSLTAYHIAKRNFDEEARRLRLAQAEELAALEEQFRAESFDLDPLLALDRLYAANSLSDVDKAALTERLLSAYAESVGDDYALYMSAEDYTAYLERQNSRFVGIGISVFAEMVNTEHGDGLRILTVYQSSPAAEASLCAGDILLTADGVSFNGKTQEEAASLVRGEENSRVTITYLHGNELKSATLTRRTVIEDTVRHAMLEGDIAYVLINRFSSATPGQLAEAVNDCLSRGARAFLFDVRNNPGGLVSSVAECLAFLLPDGELIHVEYAKKPENNYTYRAQDGALIRQTASDEKSISTTIDLKNALTCPIAVLTNENTASAGEIFAAAMRTYCQKGLIDARLIGAKTFGKGTVQATYRIEGGGAFKLTVARYTPAYGEPYDGVGLIPDRVVALPEQYKDTPLDLLPREEDSQLLAALDDLRAR